MFDCFSFFFRPISGTYIYFMAILFTLIFMIFALLCCFRIADINCMRLLGFKNHGKYRLNIVTWPAWKYKNSLALNDVTQQWNIYVTTSNVYFPKTSNSKWILTSNYIGYYEKELNSNVRLHRAMLIGTSCCIGRYQ